MFESVRFLGRPILALNPATNNTSAPLKYRSCLPRGEFFYTLPERLINAILGELGDRAFDPELLQMERELGCITGDHESRVGFWNEFPIVYFVLRRTPADLSGAANVGWNLNEAQVANMMRIANQRLSWFATVSRGFAGWLMTNQQFLGEHAELMNRWATQVRRWGTHLVGVPIPPHVPAGVFNPTGEVGWNEYSDAVIAFVVRWRLRHLAAPGLPVPMEPMMGGVVPVSILDQLMRAGGVFNWPDIFPIPSRDELREMLGDAVLRRGQSDHLNEWMEIIDRRNQAKNRIAAFGRRFELQHYWREFAQRHPGALDGNINRLKLAFATYLEVSEETVNADLIEIRKRLGSDWDQRSVRPTEPQ